MIKKPIREAKASSTNNDGSTDQDIIICGKRFYVGSTIVLWNDKGGLSCPNKRGRQKCSSHDPILNDKPTRAESKYKIRESEKARSDLKKSVHQFILHYDVCYSSHHCHEVIKESNFKGSHFYLDLDGTIYQTCDLYWKTNTAPGDDGLGNERAIHIEMANLSWQALAGESSLYHVPNDVYKKTRKGWRLKLPKKYQSKIKTPNFKPIAARSYGDRGYFSRRINGRMVRMWDFTEEQYQALINLCVAINEGLPRIKLKTPFDKKSHRTPLGKIKNFSTFEGILGHAHTQSGNVEGIKRKYDPGPAFDWGRLRKRFRIL